MVVSSRDEPREINARYEERNVVKGKKQRKETERENNPATLYIIYTTPLQENVHLSMIHFSWPLCIAPKPLLNNSWISTERRGPQDSEGETGPKVLSVVSWTVLPT